MPRTARPRRNRDGITIEDLWGMKGHQRGAHWRYRVWDPRASWVDSKGISRLGRYRRGVFYDHPDADRLRREPGCAAGDAWAKREQARLHLGQQTASQADLSTVAQAYLQELKAAGAHEGTQRNVSLAVEGLTAANATDLAAKDFRTKVTAWIGNLRTSRSKAGNGKAAASTRLRYLTHVRALVNYALTRGMLVGDPLLKLRVADDAPDTNREVFTLEELRAIAALDHEKDPKCLWVKLMLYTGMRREEALAAQWGDIDWHARVLRVQKGKGEKRRTIYLMDEAYDLLAALGGPKAKPPRVGPIVHCPTKSGVTWAQFRAVLTAAGIDPERGKDRITGMPRRLSPHSCRHTFAALMLATGFDGMDLRRTLGHSADDLTEYYSQQVDLYRHAVREEDWERGCFQLAKRMAV